MFKKLKVFHVAGLCLLFASSLRAGEEGVVASVIDGERIVVRHGGRESVVKMLGIMIPEGSRDAAIDALRIELAGHPVVVEHDVPAVMLDGRGNRLAYVYRLPEGTLMNQFLIRQGLAVVPAEGEFALRRDFSAAQSSARLENRGICSGASPALAWETQYKHVRYLGEVNYQSAPAQQQKLVTAKEKARPPAAKVRITNRKAKE